MQLPDRLIDRIDFLERLTQAHRPGTVATLEQGQERMLPGGDVGEVIFDSPSVGSDLVQAGCVLDLVHQLTNLLPPAFHPPPLPLHAPAALRASSITRS